VSAFSSISAWPRWSRWLLILGALGAVAFLTLTLVLSRFLDPEALAARVEPRMEAVLSRDVEISRVEVAFFPLGIRLRDVSVADPTGLAPFLARAGSVEFRVGLRPLFRREVKVSRLVLEDPEADLRVGPDGHSNFGDLSPQAPEEPAPADEESAPDSFALDADGRVLFTTSQIHLGPNPPTPYLILRLSTPAPAPER